MKKINRLSVILLAVTFAVNSSNAQEKLYPNEFSLGDVHLLDGPFKHARDLNIKVLLEYNVDRLFAGYRIQAGLPPKDSIYKNWDGLDGHVGGHYLSAMAMNYAATGNAECKKRMDYIVAELKACEEANAKNHPGWGVGYIGAVPKSDEIWPALMKADLGPYRNAWVPWYNVHKMYAGLRDAWLYAGSQEAKRLFLDFCDWGIRITQGLSEEQMQSMLDTEQGGMNEVFADAFQMTGNNKYLVTAKRFSHHMLLEPMSRDIDNLDNKHANTQVPKAIGFARIGELGKDDTFREAGSFFWETVTGTRSLAFGGNSRREFFPSKAASTEFVTDVEGPESCNSYNMLKLTEDLFRVHPSVKYIDYYERTLYNHILSTQNPDNGGYVYFTPARPRHYKVYSAPNEAMWCCVGSGMENHGKYNEFIYSHAHDSLYLNLFIASELNWRDRNIKIRQDTRFPYEEQTRLTITEGNAPFKLMIRYPSWITDGKLAVLINGKPVAITVHPGAYITIDRSWKKGDVVEVKLPMHNEIEEMPNVPTYVAIMHGPILLAAKTGTEDLAGLVADDSRWGHIASGKKLPIDKAPIILADNRSEITSDLVPVPGQPLKFTAPKLQLVNPINVVFEPYYQVHDSRYMMYWMALSSNQYQSYIDSIGTIEKENLALQARTVDFVAPGEQQPEADHAMQNSRSRTGNNLDQFYREARDGGYFSYKFATNGETDLSLTVKYWGDENGSRDFGIYVDDQKLADENLQGKWNQSKFMNMEYAIPVAMLQGKDHIRVKFQAKQGSIAGAVYYVRITRPK